MEGLTAICGCDNDDRMGDVIFVHGLDGDVRSTWHPKDNPEAFWPAWLGEEFPNLGIWSLGYAVSSSAWKGHSMPLADRATNTLDLLELDHIGRRPIAFICHSLGGLLVKQALRHAKDSCDPVMNAIAEQTKLIVFLSTPHSGANMASWIKHIGTILRSTVSVEELEAHHPRLRELNNWYRDQVEDMGIKTFVYCEKRKTSGILVVDETTANPGIAGVAVVPLDETHISICKPASKASQVYRRVSRLLADTFSKSSTPTLPSSNVSPSVGTFDVFLSHNSKDKQTVRELGEALKQRGLNVWLDEWELIPGRPWQEAVEDIISTTRSAAVLVGKDGIGPWEEPEMRACLDQFVKRRLPVIPVLLPKAGKQPELPLFLQAFTWVDLRAGMNKKQLDRLEWGITGVRPGVERAPPESS